VSVVFIPVYAKDVVGATPFQIGIIVGLFSLTFLSSSYVLGRWADIHGRRIVVLSGLLASAGATITQIFAYDPLSLAISRGLVGFASGSYPAALLTYAYETKIKMGKFASYGSLGWGLGSFFAGLLGIYWQIFILSALLFFIGFLLALLMPFNKERLVSVPRLPIRIIRKNLPVYLTMLIRHTGANAVWVLFAPYMIEILHFNFFQIGLVFAINPFFQFIIMQTSDRFSSVLLLYIGLISSTLGFFLMSIATGFLEMTLTQLFIGAGWGTLYVGSLKFIMEKNVEKATATGLLGSTLGVSSIIGPLIGGSLVTISLYFGLPDYLAYRTTFYTAAILCIIALVCLVYILRKNSTLKSFS